ncbi:MAG: hypothetical protein R3B72_35990 [Polyangiaceae bacterium]
MSLGPKEQPFLKRRLEESSQVTTRRSIDALPPYVDSFLAHLRLLVGVPFHYLVPDARLLPEGAVRFFYLDRSFTDRLVDGALAVGKIGSREIAHTQSHAGGVQRNADDSETLVRDLQRRRTRDFVATKHDAGRPRSEAGTITGLLLRSGLVSGWPHMEVRALRNGEQLTTLRMERLSPSVLIVLFDGVPDRVELEEPHHGVQFGVDGTPSAYRAFLRRPNGEQVRVGNDPVEVPVPQRVGGRRVLHMAALRQRLHEARSTHATAIQQSGPGSLAISLLNPPYQQPFEGAGEAPSGPTHPPLHNPKAVPERVARRVEDVQLTRRLLLFLGKEVNDG